MKNQHIEFLKFLNIENLEILDEEIKNKKDEIQVSLSKAKQNRIKTSDLIQEEYYSLCVNGELILPEKIYTAIDELEEERDTIILE